MLCYMGNEMQKKVCVDLVLFDFAPIFSVASLTVRSNYDGVVRDQMAFDAGAISKGD